ncbi:hypothetical protein JCM10908_001882 [Rhodotorula pacifica]|uniref:uncharacterized protein n=1 Tax=Rhodotorula pacifica TaxID=1495444 RepID=UPI00317C4EEE
MSFSVLRAFRWYTASLATLTHWFRINKKTDRLHPIKSRICVWLLRKHAVLSHALASGEILQIDVLDAVGLDEADVDNADALQQAHSLSNSDAIELEERHAEILEIHNSPSESRQHGAQVDSWIDSILRFTRHNFFDHLVLQACLLWHAEMTEMNNRMSRLWTPVEKTSLVKLLERFDVVLKIAAGEVESGMDLWTGCGRERAVALFLGLRLRLFTTDRPLNTDVDPSRCDPAWLDEYWYRRSALPSVDPARDL